MVNICGELTWLGLRRPLHGAVAPTPGDHSGWQEDHGTTENTEITERRTEEDPKEMHLIEGGQINRITIPDLNGLLPRDREESSPWSLCALW